MNESRFEKSLEEITVCDLEHVLVARSVPKAVDINLELTAYR